MKSLVENGATAGVKIGDQIHHADLVINNMDMVQFL
jgi:hypothetical protein